MAAMIEQDAMKNETKPQTRPSELQPLTKAEHARCAAFDRRLKDKPVRFKLVESGGLALETGETGSNEWAMTCVKYAETFNTADAGLQNHLLNQVVNTFRGAHEKPEDLLRAVNTAMAMLHEIKPRDQLEVMLVVQMIAVHNQAMQLMGRASAPGQSPELRKDDLKFAVADAPDVHHAVRGVAEVPNGRPANSHRRTRPRQCGRPGCCRHRQCRGEHSKWQMNATPQLTKTRLGVERRPGGAHPAKLPPWLCSV